jgi:hypothetical protein
MRIHGGAVAHAGARIVSFLSLAFAGIQTTTHVLFPKQQGRIVCLISFGRAGQGSSEYHAAKGSHRQFAKVASRQGGVYHRFSFWHFLSFLWLMIWLRPSIRGVGLMRVRFYSNETFCWFLHEAQRILGWNPPPRRE